MVVALLAVLAALVVLVWGSSSGDPLVTAPQGTWGEPRAESADVPTTAATARATTRPGEELPDRTTTWAIDLATALFLMAVLTTILLLLRWMSQQRVEEKERRALLEEDELVALLEATSDEVRWQALAEGDPRNGVVACWVALEQAVQRAGLHQDRAETAAELTARVLARYDVDATAITDLSEAYREARFSRHPVTETQRERAVTALERIHTDLRRRVAAEEEARAAEERSREAERIAAEDAADSHGPEDTTHGRGALAGTRERHTGTRRRRR
ncbi:hypothetical protein GCM10011366_07780 [Ornithinimicrobium tianjinense]|uniref:Protein-glutamine gamma-glutamyltransferase-like C-terminal domain-containing protein n=1 Tax=Ornithinimicrobium tianjinense TaxID=1195761 RepID=A0A917BHP8_9MICO|nr:hypothetical protein GCM10011366_07780 [Ornithinimicrobium tianjinense]